MPVLNKKPKAKKKTSKIKGIQEFWNSTNEPELPTGIQYSKGSGWKTKGLRYEKEKKNPRSN